MYIPGKPLQPCVHLGGEIASAATHPNTPDLPLSRSAYSPLSSIFQVNLSLDEGIVTNIEHRNSSVDAGSDDEIFDPATLMALLLPESATTTVNEADVNLVAGTKGNPELVAAKHDIICLSADSNVSDGVILPLITADGRSGMMAYTSSDDTQIGTPIATVDSVTDARMLAEATAVLTFPVPDGVSSVVVDNLNVVSSSLPASAGMLPSDSHPGFSFSLPELSATRYSQQSMPSPVNTVAVSSLELSSEQEGYFAGDEFLRLVNLPKLKSQGMSMLGVLPTFSQQAVSASTVQSSALLNSLAPLEIAIQQSTTPNAELNIQRALITQSTPNVDGHRLLQQVLGDRLQMQIDSQMQKATIRLDPPELGKLDISLHYSAGKLQIQIHAAQQDVWRALSQAVPELRTILSEQNQLQVNVQVSQQGGRGRERNRQQEEDQPISGNDGRHVKTTEHDDRSVITRV